ncbi:hypothetical protein MTO96_036803 [Rhipicephalus appendiculatus]
MTEQQVRELAPKATVAETAVPKGDNEPSPELEGVIDASLTEQLETAVAPEPIPGSTEESTEAPVKVLQRSCSIVFYVTDKGTSLLGLDAIQRHGIQIDGASLTCQLASCAVQCPSNVPPGFEHLFSDELGFV